MIRGVHPPTSIYPPPSIHPFIHPSTFIHPPQAMKSDLGCEVCSFEEFMQPGGGAGAIVSAAASAAPASVPSQDPYPDRRPIPSDLCTIAYTSGAGGEPKGAMLSHRAVVAAVANCVHACKLNKVSIDRGDSMLAFLPAASTFGR
jgi:long-chain acyl-CoA synthetase